MRPKTARTPAALPDMLRAPLVELVAPVELAALLGLAPALAEPVGLLLVVTKPEGAADPAPAGPEAAGAPDEALVVLPALAAA